MGASLRDYGGDGPPVIVVPSLINPPNVLDLAEGKSMLRWLAAQGFHVLLLDWGWDVAARRELSIGGHVETILLRFIAACETPPALVGYCLGGTMAIAAAAIAETSAVATIAAPWHFSAFPDDARAGLAQLWMQSQPSVEALGLLPMEMLQAAFWGLDPARTVAKFERFSDLDPRSSQAVAFTLLEDWANDGPPIGEAAARELFEGFFRDDLPGSGRWQVGGQTVDPASLPCPLFNVVSARDRIVPAATPIAAGQRLELDEGHVGMLVGSRAPETLWQPLAGWLSRVHAS